MENKINKLTKGNKGYILEAVMINVNGHLGMCQGSFGDFFEYELCLLLVK